jgi:hypothetical protein
MKEILYVDLSNSLLSNNFALHYLNYNDIIKLRNRKFYIEILIIK